jgi:predicted exporter
MSNMSAAWRRGLLWLTVMLAMAVYLLSSVRIVSDIGQFMPTDSRYPQLRALQSEMQHGPAATILLLSLHGADTKELVRLSRGLSAAISPTHSEIASIQNGTIHLDLAALQSLQPYRYMLVGQDWSVVGLHQALQQRLADLRAGAGPVIGHRLVSDPYLTLVTYLKAIAGGSGPARVDGVWLDKTMGALLMVKVKGDALDLDRMQAAVRTLRTTFHELKPSAQVRLDIAGPGVMAVATRTAIQKTIQQLSWVMLILLVVVFWLAYRSLPLMLLALVPLLSGTLVGMSLTQLIFGDIHGVVMAFGVTLLGMSIDYPLHLFSHCRHGEASHDTIKRIWPTLRLGGVSSALAFLVLLGSGFDGLSQLALFAASGVLTALWVTRYLLPNWVNPERIRPRYLPVSRKLAPRWRLFVVIVILVIPVLAWLKVNHLWENSIDAISPIPVQARELDGRLRAAMAAPNISHLFLVEGKDLDTVLQHTEQLDLQLAPLKRNKVVDDILAVTRLLPSPATQRQRQRQIPLRSELAKRLEQAVQGTPFKATAFSAFLNEAEQARTHAFITLDDLSVTALKPIIRQDLIKTDTGWLSLIRLVKVHSEAALLKWLASQPKIARHHVQLKQAVSELMQSYRQAALERMELAVLLLVVLVWLSVRRSRRLLRILFPVALGVVASLALPLLMGEALTVFHLLAAMLVMGMGLDYSLFFNRKQLIAGEHKQSMHAIAISMITTVVAFAVLAFSTIPVMSAMGSVIAFGILLCFVLAWMLSHDPAK